MNKEILVYIDLQSKPTFVGRLWARVKNNHESATFEYDKTWLAHPHRFALEPALSLDPGPYHTQADKPLFGALRDSAPDRWGRVLMRRFEKFMAERENRTPRSLLEIDYLLMVNDETREGALRFALQEQGPFLAESSIRKIPPLVELPKLLHASEHVVEENDTEEDLKLLLAPGSSLGGARPKASVRDKDKQLAIAKFPNKLDQNNIVLWEALALTLAKKAKINVHDWKIVKVKEKAILISRRFDRINTERIPFLSAMSMLAAKDNETRSYIEIVDALRQYGSNPKQDIKELWRRIVFNILISNTDDHLRNHGFLYDYEGTGWRLSPAYDLNPTPLEIKAPVLSTAIDMDDTTASIELAMSVIPYFDLSDQEARNIIEEVKKAVSSWRIEAKKLGINSREIDRMTSAFK